MAKRKKKRKVIPKYLPHPISFYFEKFTQDVQIRAFFSIALAIITALFSQIYPVCTQSRCYNVFIELLVRPELIIKPFSMNTILWPFITTVAFFTIFWFITTTIAIWIQRRRFFSDMIIPAIFIFLFIYIIIITSGVFQPIALEAGVECITNEDCILAGYCGEVCNSIYRPVYTTESPICEPLNKCICLENKCIGS